MSLTTGLGYALVRGAAAGVAAVCVGLPVSAVISDRVGGRDWSVRAARRPGSRWFGPYLAWALLLATFLTPAILVGYAYSGFSLSLIRHPGWNEALYDALLLMKLVPVAALVLHFAPRSLSPEALYCRRLLGRSRLSRYGLRRAQTSASSVEPSSRPNLFGPDLRASISFWARAEGARCAAGFAVVFLLAFGEFEMASLLVRPSWTVQLFDAQAGGILLSESLRLARLPVLIEGAVLGGVLVLLFRGRGSRRAAGERSGPRRSRGARLAVWGYLFLAALAVSVVPCLVVLRGTVEGLGVLWENFVLGRDIAASVGFALASASGAYLAAGALVRRGALFPALVALALPGLLGALVLSLVVLAAFQLPGLRLARETMVPLVLALALLLLPFALLLRALLRLSRPGEALHAAELVMWAGGGERRGRARALIWRMSGRRHFWVAFLLFFWVYFDMTASSLLAPVGTTTVFARLYNLMHYGQSQVLSAMVCLSVLVPAALLGAGLAARRLVERFIVNG